MTDGEAGTFAVLTAGVIYLASALWYVQEFGIVADERPLARGADLFEALNLAIIVMVPVALVYGAVWLHRTDLSDEDRWRAGLWCAAGFVGSVAVIAFMQMNWLLEGVAPPDEWLVQQYLIGGGTGTLAGFLVGVNDAKALRSRRKILTQRDSFRVVNEFLRHHVLNGMQIVLGNADLLRGETTDDGQARLDTIEERGDTVVDLVQRVNVLMQSLADETPLHPVALDAVLDAEVAAVREAYPAARIDSADHADVSVVADDLLGDVFENVLRNAVQHNPADTPQIEVSVVSRDEVVVVEVADDGPGVPDERKAEVFEPGEPGPRGVGKGLGLYLVDVLVRRYGGTVDVTDRNGWRRPDGPLDETPGGAVFSVTLQRA